MIFLKFQDFLIEASITKVIDRIGIEDEFKALDMDDYINHFLSKGAKRFSGGSSAEILEYKGGIIKIYAPINDPAMTRYLSFCLANKNNPFTPKMSKIMKSWATEEYRWIYAIFMENLRPSRKDFEDDMNNLLSNIDSMFRENKSAEFFSDMKSIVMKYSKKSTEKDLESVINFLKGGIRKYKYSVDFGPQNWMMRGNQLVLIDPFWPDME